MAFCDKCGERSKERQFAVMDWFGNEQYYCKNCHPNWSDAEVAPCDYPNDYDLTDTDPRGPFGRCMCVTDDLMCDSPTRNCPQRVFSRREKWKADTKLRRIAVAAAIPLAIFVPLFLLLFHKMGAF